MSKDNNTAVSLVFVNPNGDLQALEFPDVVLLAVYVIEQQLKRNDYVIIDGSILLSPLSLNQETTSGSEYPIYDDSGSQIREALPEDITLLGNRD